MQKEILAWQLISMSHMIRFTTQREKNRIKIVFQGKLSLNILTALSQLFKTDVRIKYY